MSDTANIKQELIIKDRRTLTLSGVTSIAEFGEDCLTLETSSGDITVEGEGLRIESLSKEDGSILVRGRICGVFYKDGVLKQGFLKRLFK